MDESIPTEFIPWKKRIGNKMHLQYQSGHSIVNCDFSYDDHQLNVMLSSGDLSFEALMSFWNYLDETGDLVKTYDLMQFFSNSLKNVIKKPSKTATITIHETAGSNQPAAVGTNHSNFAMNTTDQGRFCKQHNAEGSTIISSIGNTSDYYNNPNIINQSHFSTNYYASYQTTVDDPIDEQTNEDSSKDKSKSSMWPYQ